MADASKMYVCTYLPATEFNTTEFFLMIKDIAVPWAITVRVKASQRSDEDEEKSCRPKDRHYPYKFVGCLF